MIRSISGRNVAIRMAILGAIVLGTGLALAAWLGDPLFVFFGVVGALGAGLSSAVALVGAHHLAPVTRDDSDDDRRPRRVG